MLKGASFLSARFRYPDVAASSMTVRGLVDYLKFWLDDNEYQLKWYGNEAVITTKGDYATSKLLGRTKFYPGLDLSTIVLNGYVRGDTDATIEELSKAIKVSLPRSKHSGDKNVLMVGSEKGSYLFIIARKLICDREVTITANKRLARAILATYREMPDNDAPALELYQRVCNTMLGPHARPYFGTFVTSEKLVRLDAPEIVSRGTLEEEITSYLMNLSGKHGVDKVKAALAKAVDKVN